MKTYKEDELFDCPHCGEQQEYEAADYVVSGRIGKASYAITDCGYCDLRFYAFKNNDGLIEVGKR